MVNFLHVSFYKKNFIIACKRKLLLVKHFHIKQKKIKNRCNKKESYHPFCIRNERNGSTSVRINLIMKLHVPVLCTKLQPLHKMLGHHLLDVICPYRFRDVQLSEITPNHHISPTWKTSFFSIFFNVFAPHTKNQATYMIEMTYRLR
jgi:hypothetical protein